VRSFPLRTDSPSKLFTNDKHHRDFLSACHRGYEKAQNSILKAIIELRNNPDLSDHEKTFTELAYRKIIDTIAWAMLKTDTHIIHRFVYQDQPSHIDSLIILEAKKAVHRLNNESRLTFALLADLSTFIHVADVLRIDFRGGTLRGRWF